MAKNKNRTDGVQHLEPLPFNEQTPPPISTRPALAADPEPAAHFWPAGEPIPNVYAKQRRRRTACPTCRRIHLPDGGGAVSCTSSGHDVAFFRCRSCGHRWKLAVREV